MTAVLVRAGAATMGDISDPPGDIDRLAPRREGDRPRRIALSIFQAGAEADGGLTSITEIIAAVAPANRLLIFTNGESAFTERWRSLGCEVQLLSLREGRFEHAEQDRSGRLSRLTARLGANLTIARRLSRERFDVFHANDARALWSGGLAARLTGTPTILNIRDALPPRYRRAPLRWRAAYGMADIVLVLSAEMEAYWAGLLGLRTRGKLRHIHSIARASRDIPDPQGRAAIRRTLGVAEDAFVIAYVASFHPKKRQADFIDQAAGRILQDTPDAVIAFVGDCRPEQNPSAQAAVEAAERLGVGDRIRFAGFTDQPATWYVAADLVVLASEREGLPRCLIEAMIYGTPFASFAVTSAREMAQIHQAASVVALGDYPALAEAVASRARDRADDRVGLRDRAARARTLFDADTSRTRYLSLIDGLVSARGTAGS